MSEKIIYLVSRGSYSDYSICALFDSRELAEKYVELQDDDSIFHSDYRIEEFALNSFERHIREGHRSYTVQIDKSGNADAMLEDYQDEAVRFLSRCDKNGDAIMFVDTFAKDEQHAVKIANEKRAQLIAAGEWPEKESTSA